MPHVNTTRMPIMAPPRLAAPLWTALALAASSAAAQEQGVRLTALEETVHPAVRISGARVMGVMRLPEPGADAPPAFSAAIPADWAGGPACLRVASADGLYEARGTLDVGAGWAGGSAALDYGTAHPELLAEHARRGLAALVGRGGCEAADPVFAVAGLAPAGGEVVVLLNAFRAEEVLVFDARGGTSGCRRAEAEVLAAYDTLCPLPPGAFRDGAAELAILPIKDGEMGREIALTVVEPAG